MKRLSFLFALAALSLAAPVQAQFCWGIKGGVSLSNNDLTILKDKGAVLDISNYSGFFIGPKAELRIPIINLGIEAAALYSQRDMTMAEQESFTQNSILVPLNFKYAFGLGNFANIFVAAGPEFGFNVGETLFFVNKLEHSKGLTTGSIQGYIAEKSTLSINVGVGATLLNHFQVGINYNIPWGKTGSLVYIDASEIENAENIKNGENITPSAIKTLMDTADKAQNAYNNIKAGTVQVSVAYLF